MTLPDSSCHTEGMLARFVVLAAIPAALTASVPQSFSLRVPDLNPRDSARVLAADRSGNLFVVSSSPQTSAIVNIHIVKTDPAGNFLAAFDFGGSGIDTPTAATVDPQGNLIVAGATQSADFPMVSPVLSTGVAFATKIDAQLHQILFSTRLGATGGGPVRAGVSAVAVDSAGNIYLAGSTSAGFLTTTGVLQPQAPVLSQAGSISHGFVMELSAAGDRVVFSTYFSGAGFVCATPGASPCLIFQPPTNLSPPVISTTPSAIAVDSAGNVIVAGITNSSSLPVSAGAYATQCGCTNLNSVAFIAGIGAGGTKLTWGTYLPPGTPPNLYAPSIVGVPLDTITSMALDAAGHIVIAGNAVPGFPISAGAAQTVFPSPSGYAYAGYVAELDAIGSKLLFSTWLGGGTSIMSTAGPAALSIDPTGTIWITGSAGLATLPAPAGTPLLGENYIAGLSASGSSVLSLFTIPNGGAGAAIQATATGNVDALGVSGALLLSSTTVGPSLLGLAGSVSWTASASVAPRELLSLYGAGIGPSTAQSASISGGTISHSLGGVQVLFDGVPAALLYAGFNQINAIVPSATSGRRTTAISIITPAGTIAGPTLPIVPTLPQVSASIYGYANALNEDGTVNSFSNPAGRGSIVTIWVIGGGAQSNTPDSVINTAPGGNPNPVSILTANPQIVFEFTSLEVLYAGDAPGLPSGVIQVNFRLSSGPPTNYQIQIGDATAPFLLFAH